MQAFQAMLQYLIADSQTDTDSWEVSDVLSLSNTDKEITAHTGGPTVDPAVWFDWKNITNDILQNNSHSHNISDNYFLSREQSLKAMCYFLQKRYWEQNHDMLLIDAVKDLQKIINQDNLDSSVVWKEWLESIKKALSFKEVFE